MYCPWSSLVLGLVMLPDALHVHAQLTTNENVTLRFFTNGLQEGSCSYSNTSRALTFTTSSIPVSSHCFDVSELFGGNTTQGFVNQTDDLGRGTWVNEAGIHWQLRNLESYDPQANYSGVLYHQRVTSPVTDDNKPGEFASRRVTIYPGEGCTEKDPSNSESLLPWYGFDCWSEDEGSCGILSYNVASFYIQPGLEQDEQRGTCWAFAKMGAASSLCSPGRSLVGGLLSALLSIWLVI